METYRIFFYNPTCYVPNIAEREEHGIYQSIMRDFNTLGEAAAFAEALINIGCDFTLVRMSGWEG